MTTSDFGPDASVPSLLVLRVFATIFCSSSFGNFCNKSKIGGEKVWNARIKNDWMRAEFQSKQEMFRQPSHSFFYSSFLSSHHGSNACRTSFSPAAEVCSLFGASGGPAPTEGAVSPAQRGETPGESY